MFTTLFNKLKTPRVKKLIACVLAVSAFAMMLSTTCFAATSIELFTKISDALDTVHSWIFGISSTIAIICAIFCVIRMMATSDAKQHETMKQWLIRILVGWVIINLLAVLLKSAVQLFGGSVSVSVG